MASDPMDVDSEFKENDDAKVDEQLYSRQLYVIDHESMAKMQKASVLIAGMNGLGAEIAKNTILAGVKSVSIMDHSTVRIRDLGSNFYLRPDAVGKQTRAQCCIAQLKSLNPHVRTQAITDKSLSLEALIESKQYDVIVMVGYPLKDCLKYNQLTHKLGLGFISCDAAGVFGQLFVDLGPHFECTDLTGEPPVQGMVVNVSKAANGVVQVHEDQRHGLSDGDFVRFEEVEGMTELNGSDPVPIKVTSPFAFEIGDTSSMGEYTGNGLYFEVKQGAKLSFHSLTELMAMSKDELLPNYPKPPKITQSDFSKDQYEQHLFYLALQQFRGEHNGAYPAATNPKEAEAVFATLEGLCTEHGLDHPSKEKADEYGKWRLKWTELARTSGSTLSPMCAFMGGVVGQEVLKACSHKFTPLQQLLYYDGFECLPTAHVESGDYKQFGAANSRYDDYVAVFGAEIQRKVMESSMFMVGAGAIGCEMLKNWALMGVACDGSKGRVVVTDMDRIETSNLNRQFLFRQKDVNAPKSTTAAKAVMAMNGDMKVEAHENRVGAESESVYDFEFWSGLDAVCTALDNVQARLYVDAQCVSFRKPLLESGTLGTKGHTQIVVPRMTESYGSTRDPEAKGVPICTLKNFPNKMEHAIQWARDDLEGTFKQIPVEINHFLVDGDEYLKRLHADNPAEELTKIEQIGANLVASRPSKFADCVHWARCKFEADFANRIKQLLYNFPHDAVTTEGAKFWSPPKRAPNVMVFDEDDPLHFAFIVAAANLRAFVYGLKGTADASEVKAHLKSCVVPQFEVNESVKIAATDEEEKEQGAVAEEMDYDEELAAAKGALPDRKQLIGMKLSAVEFEKDDDSNFHMAFVAAAANLRARNYRIAEQSKHDIKRIAGNIIPAIATTTALVTGLISLELYKLVQGEAKGIEQFRNSYVNLALPLVTMSEPVACDETTIYKKGKQWSYSLWDKIEIRDGGKMTVADLLQYFDAEWDCDLNMLSFGNAMLYAFYMDAIKLMKRKKMTLKALVEEVCGIEIGEEVKCLHFEVNVDYQNPPEDEDEDDEPMLPTVVVYL